MGISLKTIATVEKQRGRSSNTLKVTTIDGQEMSVPKDMGNKEYRVVNEWIKRGGQVMPPPPKPISKDRPKSAYLPHKILNTPPDKKSIIRYMSFEQFVSLLSCKALWFTRGNVLKNIDPYEGELPEPNLKVPPAELLEKVFKVADFRKEDVERFFESHRVTQEVFRVNTLINCWTIFDHESYAMWKVYGKGNNCIAIRTSVGSLKKSFGNYVDYDVYIGEIKYIDYSKQEIDESNYFNMFMHKTPPYSTEKELRCVILDDGDISLFSKGEPYFCGVEEVTGLSPGTHVPCNLEELLLEVIIGPESDTWFDDVVQSILSQFGFENITLSMSEIRRHNI